MYAKTRQRCTKCLTVHKLYSNAKACCAARVRQVEQCSRCKKVYTSVVDAGQCCHEHLPIKEEEGFGRFI